MWVIIILIILFFLLSDDKSNNTGKRRIRIRKNPHYKKDEIPRPSMFYKPQKKWIIEDE